MARETYVLRGGKLVAKRLAAPLAPAGRVHVISDSLDDVFNHADGRRYSSKAAYYRAVRQAGCEIVGNDTKSLASRQQQMSDAALGGLGADIKTSIDQLKAGYRP